MERAKGGQQRRSAGQGIPFNAAILGGRIMESCNFDPDGLSRFKATVHANSLSTRSMDRLAKVARTIADLEGDHQVAGDHQGRAERLVVGGRLRDPA